MLYGSQRKVHGRRENDVRPPQEGLGFQMVQIHVEVTNLHRSFERLLLQKNRIVVVIKFDHFNPLRAHSVLDLVRLIRQVILDDKEDILFIICIQLNEIVVELLIEFQFLRLVGPQLEHIV